MEFPHGIKIFRSENDVTPINNEIRMLSNDFSTMSPLSFLDELNARGLIFVRVLADGSLVSSSKDILINDKEVRFKENTDGKSYTVIFSDYMGQTVTNYRKGDVEINASFTKEKADFKKTPLERLANKQKKIKPNKFLLSLTSKLKKV